MYESQFVRRRSPLALLFPPPFWDGKCVFKFLDMETRGEVFELSELQPEDTTGFLWCTTGLDEDLGCR
jgi:hypothetical protein